MFDDMLKIFYSPEIQGCLAAIESIVGYKLTEADREPFLYLHDYITNPQPAFITTWRSDPKLEKWYHLFTNGFLMNVQNTLACVLYHHGRLQAIERTVMDSTKKFNYQGILGINSSIGIPNTLVWDFEYQAFVLAYRRCLDYLARAISAYFRNDFHSFRQLGAFLGKVKPQSVAHTISPLHAKYCPLFEFVVSEGERKSLRDRISHYEYVPVGTINLTQHGFVLARQGENLGDSSRVVKLSEVLDGHVANLRGCIREFIHHLVEAIRAEESTS